MIVAEHSHVRATAHVFDAAMSGEARNLRRTLCDVTTPGWSNSDSSNEILDQLLGAMGESSVQVGGIDVEAFNRALTLAFSLPRSVPTPDVVIEDDGEIAFDWDEGPRKVLSVSIGVGPMLTYAALIGPEPTHGRVAFAGSLPETLAFLLRRIYPGGPNHL